MIVKESAPQEVPDVGVGVPSEPEEVAETQDTDDLVEFLSRKIEEQRKERQVHEEYREGKEGPRGRRRARRPRSPKEELFDEALEKAEEEFEPTEEEQEVIDEIRGEIDAVSARVKTRWQRTVTYKKLDKRTFGALQELSALLRRVEFLKNSLGDVEMEARERFEKEQAAARAILAKEGNVEHAWDTRGEDRRVPIKTYIEIHKRKREVGIARRAAVRVIGEFLKDLEDTRSLKRERKENKISERAYQMRLGRYNALLRIRDARDPLEELDIAFAEDLIYPGEYRTLRDALIAKKTQVVEPTLEERLEKLEIEFADGVISEETFLSQKTVLQKEA